MRTGRRVFFSAEPHSRVIDKKRKELYKIIYGVYFGAGYIYDISYANIVFFVFYWHEKLHGGIYPTPPPEH
jgi:hypothetical protein